MSSLFHSKAAWLLTAALASGSAMAACPSDNPAAIAQAFYTHHADFYNSNPAKIRQAITPRLFAALTQEYICKQGEICAIEADPWIDAQDGTIGQPVSFTTLSNTRTEAKVLMMYSFMLDHQSHPQHATVVLQRPTPSSCLVVSDVIGPHGHSLLRQLESWHRQYGKAH